MIGRYRIAPQPLWAYSAAIDMPDVDTTTALPPGWGWSRLAGHIVNSDGSRAGGGRGGCLLTPPAPTPDALAALATPAWRTLRPGHNYRAHLRITVHIPGLADELDALRALANYSRLHLRRLWERIDPLSPLVDQQLAGRSAPALLYRYQVAEPARHHLVGDDVHAARRRATTLRTMLAAEVPAHRDGRPAWRAGRREAINLLGLLSRRRAIEFRCYAAPQDLVELRAGAGFAGGWIEAALTRRDPLVPVSRWGVHLPRQLPFDALLEAAWVGSNPQRR